ncbi:MAG: B12-binding domain-containing radical SAM protein [Oscillospiraceae bacterium]|jgi:radical SAM superfamily enzyme YgiQ (UPF0313 family)|nr:B12-binding domain-containing radical SAM protein [Oscillospiraceae bacterium]
MDKPVVLVNFYTPKSLGMRYLEGALRQAGFDVAVVYFKGFHSVRPQKPTSAEIEALTSFLRGANPLFTGFSVMSSLYLDAVTAVSEEARKALGGASPLVWGGVYPTLFPERSLRYCDLVLRGEGEGAIADLASRLRGGSDIGSTPNLAYMRGGEAVVNPVRPLAEDLDALPMAALGTGEKYFIDGEMRKGDPALASLSYETSCSRGCPFACAYCSTAGIKRVYAGQAGRYLRFRSVDSVISELKAARAAMKNLSFIHFWDEIFTGNPAWIGEFAGRYRAEVNLPFDIWAHPLTTNARLIAALRGAGLEQVVMGIQSGSPSVRKNAFRRAETQEQIMEAARILADAKVPRVIYDLILRHPFESLDEIKESYELCARLPGRFTLQMHGLNLLPGTEIADEAVKRGIYTPEQLEAVMYAPMETQYASWWEASCRDEGVNFWYKLTYLTQFASMKKKAAALAGQAESGIARAKADKCHKKARRLARARHYWQKGKAVLKGKLRR